MAFFFYLPCAKIKNFRFSLDKYLPLHCFAVSLPVAQQDKFKTLYVIAEPIISLSQFYTSRYCGPSSHPKYASIMFIFVGQNQSHETFKSHEIKDKKCVCINHETNLVLQIFLVFSLMFFSSCQIKPYIMTFLSLILILTTSKWLRKLKVIHYEMFNIFTSEMGFSYVFTYLSHLTKFC